MNPISFNSVWIAEYYHQPSNKINLVHSQVHINLHLVRWVTLFFTDMHKKRCRVLTWHLTVWFSPTTVASEVLHIILHNFSEEVYTLSILPINEQFEVWLPIYLNWIDCKSALGRFIRFCASQIWLGQSVFGRLIRKNIDIVYKICKIVFEN